jgi:crotonobetainyl-CoA:carnitine CoA-transferase CaiB-like acyl-CoA transferase
MTTNPMQGVRIIELCGWFTGPMATCMLADQGADVIKVEPPGGDGYRISGTSRNGHAAMFMSANRNKRSITLDLKQAAHKQALLTLIEHADVFVQNMKPGAMARMGLDASTLREKFPRLIHVSISGYGQTGPNSAEGAFDTMLQALTGMMTIQGDNERGRPEMMRTLVVDKATSPIVAQAISAALFHRERSGEGCTLEYAMLDGMIWWMWPDAMMNHTFIGEGVRQGTDVAEVNLICETDDGYLVTTPHLQRDWEQFIELVGRPELAHDPKLETDTDRGRHLDYYTAAVRASFRGKTTGEWCSLLRARGIPCAPVLRRDQIATYPQVIWNQVIEEVEHPQAGRHRSVRSPIRFDGHAAGVMRPSPAAGADTDEVLREFGIVIG